MYANGAYHDPVTRTVFGSVTRGGNIYIETRDFNVTASAKLPISRGSLVTYGRVKVSLSNGTSATMTSTNVRGCRGFCYVSRDRTGVLVRFFLMRPRGVTILNVDSPCNNSVRICERYHSRVIGSMGRVLGTCRG